MRVKDCMNALVKGMMCKNVLTRYRYDGYDMIMSKRSDETHSVGQIHFVEPLTGLVVS